MNNTLIYSYIEDIAKRIHDPALHGAASVMVGAGFSKNAIVVDDETPTPSWEELAISMFEALYKKPSSQAELQRWEIQKIKKTSGKNVLKLAEEYKSVFGRNKLNKFIEANINDDGYIPGDLHKKLLSLKWRDVFTTNYDTLLEKAIDKIDVKFNYKILTSQNDLPGSTHPRIIKLHGSVDSTKHYIICEEDYRIYPIQYAPFVNTVQQAMLETQLCLIGFSGDDPNFLSWLGWLRDNMGENSPNIYLVGLFRNMSISEKMTLENQNITILDLGDMFDNKSDVGHQEALDAFLNKLSEYGKESERIFEPVPYENQLRLFEQNFQSSITDEYFDVMDEFLLNMKEKANGYLAFQNNNETRVFIDSIGNHFNELLTLNPSSQQVNTLSKIVYFLRKGCSILEDNNANNLLKVINAIELEDLRNSKTLLTSWVEISLYLLEMYRIDGRNEDYERLLEKVEKETEELEGYVKEELQIEKCKFLISSFDYINAIEEVSKINHSIALDIQLKKIFLYKQLDEVEKGKDLLRKASALLVQKKYSENKTASLRGYLNLCARSLMNVIDNNFSDEEYCTNSYNVRNIYNQIKNDVSDSLLLAYNESRGKIPDFNPGTYKITYGTITKKEKNAISNPLKYVVFQDLLCLPNTFADHREILALALKEIIGTSKVPIWKWSSIIRTNDSKIINSFFKRELVMSSDKDWITVISDQLFKLADSFNDEYMFNSKNRIIKQETIYDVLSRFSIMMDDDKVIRLINLLLEKSIISTKYDFAKFIKFFMRVKFSINTNIMSHFLHRLLSSDVIPLEFLFEFANADISVKSIEIPDNLIKQIVNEIKSKDPEVRDKAIVKILLIKSNIENEKLNSQIAEALWEQTDDVGFPKTKDFRVWIWNDLPSPECVNMNNLYMEYLKHPEFIRTVNDGSISGLPTVDNPINGYIQRFKRVSDFRKRGKSGFKSNWISDYFLNTIKYIYDYIDNEKALLSLKFDIFGSEVEGRKRITKLGDFVAMLAAQAYLSDVYTDEVANSIQSIETLLNNNGIKNTSIKIVKKVIAGECIEVDIESLMNIMILGEIDELEQAISVMEILLGFEENTIPGVHVSSHIVELISSITYLDVSRSNMVVSKLIFIINHPTIVQEKYRDDIIRAFKINKDKLDPSFNKTSRELINNVYSLSILIKMYYKSLVKHSIKIPEELTAIAKELNRSKLKEVKNMWEFLD